ncbi:hypothetical protein KAI92_02355 [Candidatus Parcubacteria bacterium]|nr:hypothetical protein [Candidatus Parcubacteria bacterium]
MDFKEKFSELIKKSDLTSNQKGLWGLFITKASPEENEAVYEAVDESNENLTLLTEHLKSKVLELNERVD